LPRKKWQEFRRAHKTGDIYGVVQATLNNPYTVTVSAVAGTNTITTTFTWIVKPASPSGSPGEPFAGSYAVSGLQGSATNSPNNTTGPGSNILGAQQSNIQAFLLGMFVGIDFVPGKGLQKILLAPGTSNLTKVEYQQKDAKTFTMGKDTVTTVYPFTPFVLNAEKIEKTAGPRLGVMYSGPSVGKFKVIQIAFVFAQEAFLKNGKEDWTPLEGSLTVNGRKVSLSPNQTNPTLFVDGPEKQFLLPGATSKDGKQSFYWDIPDAIMNPVDKSLDKSLNENRTNYLGATSTGLFWTYLIKNGAKEPFFSYSWKASYEVFSKDGGLGKLLAMSTALHKRDDFGISLKWIDRGFGPGPQWIKNLETFKKLRPALWKMLLGR
jgi:hypothetical protein